MKLCNCPDLHFSHGGLPVDVHGRRCCGSCYQAWMDMRKPTKDILGRFIDGSIVLHWRDGYVNLVDVGGEKLIARRYYDNKKVSDVRMHEPGSDRDAQQEVVP